MRNKQERDAKKRSGGMLLDGKKYFHEVCRQHGIDCDTYFKVGLQNRVEANGYVYRCPHTNRKPSQIFAVNYLRDLDVYVAWSLKTSKADTYNSFRVLKAELAKLQEGKLLPIVKSIEYSGWDEETVFAFDRTAVDDFLKMCFKEE